MTEFWLTDTMFLNNERFNEKRYLGSFGNSGTSKIQKLDTKKTRLHIITCYKERVLEMSVVLGWDVAQFELGMF